MDHPESRMKVKEDLNAEKWEGLNQGSKERIIYMIIRVPARKFETLDGEDRKSTYHNWHIGHPRPEGDYRIDR
jgi:hypothetical protein